MLLRPAPCNLTLQGVASVLTGPLEAPRLDAETARFYVPELDSLRFLGFLAVFICHLFDEMGGSLVMTNTGTFGRRSVLYLERVLNHRPADARKGTVRAG